MNKVQSKNVFIFEDDEKDFFMLHDLLVEKGYIVYPSSREEFIEFKDLLREYSDEESNHVAKQIVERFRTHNPLFFTMDLNLSNKVLAYAVGGANKLGGTIRAEVIQPHFPFVPCVFFTRYDASTADEYMQNQDRKVAKGDYARHLRNQFWADKLWPIIKSIELNNL